MGKLLIRERCMFLQAPREPHSHSAAHPDWQRGAQVLLREAAPGSPLLALRPVTDSGMSAQPRLRDVAAMQQSGNRVRFTSRPPPLPFPTTTMAVCALEDEGTRIAARRSLRCSLHVSELIVSFAVRLTVAFPWGYCLAV
jgi:hypothetical protein